MSQFPNFSEFRVNKSLENQWQQLKLTKEEDNEILIDEELLVEGIKKGDNNIVEKLHSDQTISKEIICTTC